MKLYLQAKKYSPLNPISHHIWHPHAESPKLFVQIPNAKFIPIPNNPNARPFVTLFLKSRFP